MYKALGEVLKKLRIKRGWTLEYLTGQLGDIRGADSSGIQRIEAGKKKAPLELYVALATAYELPLSTLIAMAEQIPGAIDDASVDEEESLIASYRAMEPSQQSVFRELGKVMARGKGLD